MKKWIALTIIAAFSGTSFPQVEPSLKNNISAKQEHKKHKVNKPTSNTKSALVKAAVKKFSVEMLEAGRIDPAYEGMPAIDIINAIEKLLGEKKGEFESTADYNSRKTNALAENLLDDVGINDIIVFKVPVLSGANFLGNGFKYTYNPDASEAHLYVLPKTYSFNGIGAPDALNEYPRNSNKLDLFDLDFKVIDKSTYQAGNAYGATVSVEKTIALKTGLAASKIPFLHLKRDYEYYNADPAVRFNIENSKAEKELPLIKALIFIKISKAYIIYDFNHSDPTRNRPIEHSTQSKFLTGSIDGIVFYSGKTGEIFGRVPDNFGQSLLNLQIKTD